MLNFTLYMYIQEKTGYEGVVVWMLIEADPRNLHRSEKQRYPGVVIDTANCWRFEGVSLFTFSTLVTIVLSSPFSSNSLLRASPPA